MIDAMPVPPRRDLLGSPAGRRHRPELGTSDRPIRRLRVASPPPTQSAAGIWLSRHTSLRLAHVVLGASLVLSAIVTAYYYNLFVDMEQNVITANAQIDRELQRRSDLIENLLPAVFEYAALERHVFTEVAKVRAQVVGLGTGDGKLAEALKAGPKGVLAKQKLLGNGGRSLADLVGRLVAVSEQYPDMKSSAPFEMLMEKVVEIEDRLATERKNYNDCVNMYTTLTSSFPGKLFAQIFEFEDHPLFAAEPKARLRPRIATPFASSMPPVASPQQEPSQ